MVSENGKGFIGECERVMNIDPTLGPRLNISTPGELAEKLAVTLTRVIDPLIDGNKNLQPIAREIKGAVVLGDYDRAETLGEIIYKHVNPNSEIALMDTVFDSLLTKSSQTGV